LTARLLPQRSAQRDERNEYYRLAADVVPEDRLDATERDSEPDCKKKEAVVAVRLLHSWC
jgi:hypothetical protein